MTLIKISIDNNLVSSLLVNVFYQKEPFPGNHSYSLSITFEDSKKRESIINRYCLNDFPNAQINMFFLYLSSIWPSEENVVTKYFINNVDKIKLDGNNIELVGIASDIIGLK